MTGNHNELSIAPQSNFGEVITTLPIDQVQIEALRRLLEESPLLLRFDASHGEVSVMRSSAPTVVDKVDGDVFTCCFVEEHGVPFTYLFQMRADGMPPDLIARLIRNTSELHLKIWPSSSDEIVAIGVPFQILTLGEERTDSILEPINSIALPQICPSCEQWLSEAVEYLGRTSDRR